MSEANENKAGGMSFAVNTGLVKTIAQEHAVPTVMVIDVGSSYKQQLVELSKDGGEAIVANANSRILRKE